MKLLSYSALLVGAMLCLASARLLAAGASGEFVGSYSVPTPLKLAPVAGFDGVGVMYSTSAGQRHLQYTLPDDLDYPNSNTIVLDEVGASGGFVQFSGQLADARCVIGDGARATCMMAYKKDKLVLDGAATQAYLKTQYATDPQLQARLAVAHRFSTEPIGVLTVVLGN